MRDAAANFRASFAGGPWDRRLAARAAALSAAAALLAWVVVAATDEGTPAAGRVARLASILPACGALGAWITVAQQRARGEARAVEALGASPFAVVRGAVLGGALVALAAPLLAALPAVDVASLFPRAEPPHPFRAVAGGLVDPLRGVVIARGGALAAAPRELVEQAALRGERLATATTLALAALAAPAWSVAPGGRARRVAIGLAVVLGAIAAFHLVAAARAPAVALVAPVLVLVGDALVAYAARR